MISEAPQDQELARRALRELYESFSRRLELEPDMSVDAMRDLFDQWHQATGEAPGVTYAEAVGAPVPATWCIPAEADDQRAVVYTHGGGFVVGSRHSHRKLAGHLATCSASRVLIIDYRRAPEHPHPAQVEDTVATAKWVLASEGRSPSKIALAGDSAGGNIAVSSALALAAEGLAPSAVVAMSPWFDMENSGESLEENAEHDAMVDKATLEIMTGLVLDGVSPVTAAANPLHADLSCLPPVFVTASEHETLRDDATRFAARAEEAGRDVTLQLERAEQHVFQMAAGRSAVADHSLQRIGAWLRQQFEAAAPMS